MALPVEITEINQGREAADDDKGERTYTRVFRLRYDVATPGPGQAIIQQLVQRYDVYQEPGGYIDETALAMSGSAAPESPDDSFNHLVTIRYTTKLWDEVGKGLLAATTGTTGSRPHGSGGSQAESNSPANPLARPSLYSWGTVPYREFFEHDYDFENSSDGFIINLTNRRPYDPPLETERRLLTLTIKRNTLTYDPIQADFMINKVNLFEVTIANRLWEEGMVKCDSWTAETQIENEFIFWAETLVFTFKKGKLVPNKNPPIYSKWLRVLLQADTMELRNNKLVTISRQGHPDNRAWPLDNAGQALPEGYAATDLYYRTYVEFTPYNFAIFGSL